MSSDMRWMMDNNATVIGYDQLDAVASSREKIYDTRLWKKVYHKNNSWTSYVAVSTSWGKKRNLFNSTTIAQDVLLLLRVRRHLLLKGT